MLDPETGCLLWKGVKNAKGYGRFGDHLAHRFAFERARGPIPPGLQPDHLCRNPSCVNHEHIELVTPAVNTQRGRKAKLTVDQVLAIRAATGKQAEIAANFGISPSQVSSIRSRRYWQNV